jgi:hypothetical protein
MCRALVCGGRDYTDRAALFRSLDELHAQRHFTLIIHGDATGADRLAGQWARLTGVPEDANPPKGVRFGTAAVFSARNTRMLLKNPDVVIAFPGGPGTRNMIVQAELSGIEVVRIGR